MPFSAKLFIDNEPHVVQSFNWGMHQNTDAIGRPDALVQGGQLQVEITSQYSETLHNWALDNTKKMSGSLVVYGGDGVSSYRTIKFKEAYCVGLAKNFDGSSSDQGMIMLLTISANQLSADTVDVDNKWPK